MRAPRRRITVCCMDMAGTTVSDDGLVEAAFLDALAARGVGEDDPRREGMLDYVRETMGTSKIVVFRALFPEEADAQAANAAFEAAYARRLDDGLVTPMPGAAETIAALRGAGVKVALLTGFSAETRDRLVAALRWEAVADLLICPAEAGRGRPYPDMVLGAFMRLGGEDVRDVAVVGDTAADVASGIHAGASVVAGVLSGADDAARLEAAGATHVLGSVAELPPILGL